MPGKSDGSGVEFCCFEEESKIYYKSVRYLFVDDDSSYEKVSDTQHFDK